MNGQALFNFAASLHDRADAFEAVAKLQSYIEAQALLYPDASLQLEPYRTLVRVLYAGEATFSPEQMRQLVQLALEMLEHLHAGRKSRGAEEERSS